MGLSEIAGMNGVGTSIDEVFADRVLIRGYILNQVPTGLNISDTEAASNPNFGGVIGNNLLQRFNQIWCFSAKRLYLQPIRRMYAEQYTTTQTLLKNKVILK